MRSQGETAPMEGRQPLVEKWHCSKMVIIAVAVSERIMVICNKRMNIVCNVTGIHRTRENEAQSIRRRCFAEPNTSQGRIACSRNRLKHLSFQNTTV